MKKVVFTLVIALFACAISFAQVMDKGNFLMGGSFGFSSANSAIETDANGSSVSGDGATATQLNFAPKIGYFFANNFVGGLGLNYTFNKNEEPVDFGNPDSELDESFDSDLLFGPFLRYYMPIGGRKAFFVESTFGFGNSFDEFQTDSGSQTASTSVFAVGVGPGFTIFSSDAVGIEALFKYNFATSNSSIDFDEVNTEITTTTNQFDFSVGFQYYFTRAGL